MKCFKIKSFLIILFLSFCVIGNLFSHCEMPCGIYADKARFDDFDEDITTLVKAVNEIQRLSAIKKPDVTTKNQLVRWIGTKETHAGRIQYIATEYFLTQRVKLMPNNGDIDPKKLKIYYTKLTLLHEIVVKAMKCKQTVDLEMVKSLSESIAKFKKVYIGVLNDDHKEHRQKKDKDDHNHDDDDDDDDDE